MTGFAWTEEVLARVDKLVHYNAEEQAKQRGALYEALNVAEKRLPAAFSCSVGYSSAQFWASRMASMASSCLLRPSRRARSVSSRPGRQGVGGSSPFGHET